MAESLFLGFEHVGIKIKNINQSVRFYTEILGFSVLNRFKDGSVELALLSLGSSLVELIEDRVDINYRDGAINHLALRVSDIFTAKDLLNKHAVELITPEPVEIMTGGYNLFFRGPSGEKLELFQK